MVNSRSVSISASSYLILVDLVRDEILGFKRSIERYEEYCKEHADDKDDSWRRDLSFDYKREDFDKAVSKLPSFQKLLLELYGFGG